ncbi:hypothetical protein L7F22_005420 [Adiantum nelumboides]|nr:hypothetical protein [Adiantum nelumboides]
MEELVSCRLFPKQQCIGAGSTETLLPSLIWACSKNKDLQRGTRIHNKLRQINLPQKNFLNALVTMYAKCGDLQKAQALLNTHSSSSLIPWNALIAGYARQRKGQNALHYFENMQHKGGLFPSAVTYVCILKACAAIGEIDKGKQIHFEILRQGLLEHHVKLGPKCPSAAPFSDVVSWSALIAGYAQNGLSQKAFDCFDQMHREGIFLDEATFLCTLKACAVIGAIEKGKQIHDQILMQGLLEHHIVLVNALVDMYAKCNALHLAKSVLEKLPSRNVVSWNALIAGYAQNGQGQQALDCLECMQREGIVPDEITCVFILKGCALIGAIDKGKQIHDEISTQGCWSIMLLWVVLLWNDTANTIYTDSQSALTVARNPVFHARTKHIEVHYHYVRERLLARDISLAYVPPQDNLADLFTKTLSREKLEAFHKALGLLPFVD